jgi:hypothetical protein
VQIPLPPVDEKKKVVEDVDKDRRYAIDASIVRIMKSRKVMAHTQLVAECVEQLSRMFKVLTVHFLFSTYLVIWNLALAVVAHQQIPFAYLAVSPFFPSCSRGVLVDFSYPYRSTTFA